MAKEEEKDAGGSQPAKVLSVPVSEETWQGLSLLAADKKIEPEAVLAALAAKAAKAALAAHRVELKRQEAISKLAQSVQDLGRQREALRQQIAEMRASSERDRQALDEQITRTAESLNISSKKLGKILRKAFGEDWDQNR